MNLAIVKAKRFKIRETVIGLAKIGPKLNSLSVGFNTPFLVPHCFKHVAKANMRARYLRVEGDRSAVGINGVFRSGGHRQRRTVIIMSQGIVRLNIDSAFQYRNRFFVMMQLFKYGSQIVPGCHETRFGLGDAFKNNPGIFEAFRHDGNSCQQQCGIDVIGVFTNQSLSEFF